jgi:hypothetical protein
MMKIYLLAAFLFYMFFLSIGFITGKFILINKRSYEYLLHNAINKELYRKILGIQLSFISVYLLCTSFIGICIRATKTYYWITLIIFFIINALIQHKLNKLKK